MTIVRLYSLYSQSISLSRLNSSVLPSCLRNNVSFHNDIMVPPAVQSLVQVASDDVVHNNKSIEYSNGKDNNNQSFVEVTAFQDLLSFCSHNKSLNFLLFSLKMKLMKPKIFAWVIYQGQVSSKYSL